jgi:hypothetical protein
MKNSHTIYKLLRKLEETDIPFRIDRLNSESIVVTAMFSRSIVDFKVFENGHLEISEYHKTPSILQSIEDVYSFIDGYNYEKDLC